MRAVAIYPDPKGLPELEHSLSLRNDITLCRSFEAFPDAETLARSLRAWAPAIIFLDINHPAVEQTNAQLATEFPQIRRVAIHAAQVPEVFRRVLQMGMRELVNPPFKNATFGMALDRLAADIVANPPQQSSACRVSAFMPAKAGVGASTIAAHASWAVAANPESRVLLMDLDRHSGITAFQFNVEPEYTIQDALTNSVELDEDSWRRLVKQQRNVDLLLSKPGELHDANTDRFVAPLIRYAQRNYTTVHIDLPDTLDAYSLAALHQADQIFIVATPELPALRLARLKADALRRLDLEGRTRLLLNRMNHRLGLSPQDIEDAVGMEVFATLPCDYAGVSASLRTAQPSPKLAKGVHELLDKLSEHRKPRPQRRRFLERISVPFTTNLRGSSDVQVLR